MRVFSQINNCQQKQKQETDKTKRGAPLLGLAKSIYYRRSPKSTHKPSQFAPKLENQHDGLL